MSHALRRWRPTARRLGWPAALAAVLTLAALAGALQVASAQDRLDARRQAVGAQRLTVQQSAKPAQADAHSFIRSLPPDGERQARTAALLALTAEQGLPWPRSEFRYQTDAETGLAQYRVAMSLAGRYAALRNYVAEALRRDPALALEGVRLRRDANGELKADLTWVLHMQAAR